MSDAASTSGEAKRVSDGRVDDREQQQVPRPPGAEQRELTLGIGEARTPEQHGEEQQVVARDGERPARELRAHGGHAARSRGERKHQQDGQGTDSVEIAREQDAHAGHHQQHARVQGGAQLKVQGEHLPAIERQGAGRRGVVDHALGAQGPQFRFERMHGCGSGRDLIARLNRRNGPAGSR